MKYFVNDLSSDDAWGLFINYVTQRGGRGLNITRGHKGAVRNDVKQVVVLGLS